MEKNVFYIFHFFSLRFLLNYFMTNSKFFFFFTSGIQNEPTCNLSCTYSTFLWMKFKYFLGKVFLYVILSCSENFHSTNRRQSKDLKGTNIWMGGTFCNLDVHDWIRDYGIKCSDFLVVEELALQKGGKLFFDHVLFGRCLF